MNVLDPSFVSTNKSDDVHSVKHALANSISNASIHFSNFIR